MTEPLFVERIAALESAVAAQRLVIEDLTRTRDEQARRLEAVAQLPDHWGAWSNMFPVEQVRDVIRLCATDLRERLL